MSKNKFKFYILLIIFLNLSACYKSDFKFTENWIRSREQYAYTVENRDSLYNESYGGYYKDPSKLQKKTHGRFRDEYSRSPFIKNQ